MHLGISGHRQLLTFMRMSTLALLLPSTMLRNLNIADSDERKAFLTCVVDVRQLLLLTLALQLCDNALHVSTPPSCSSSFLHTYILRPYGCVKLACHHVSTHLGIINKCKRVFT